MNDERKVDHIYEAEQKRVDQDYTSRMYNSKLMALRGQLPFLEIVPFPNSSISVKLAANAAQDLNLPDGTKLIRFKADGVFYVSRNGQAQIPTGTTPDGSGSIMSPDWAFMYVEEIRALSVIAPASTNLTVYCFQQL